MGGVCSGGTVKKSGKTLEFDQHVKNSGFSGKLKSVGSFEKKKNCDDSYAHPDEIDVCKKAPQNFYDSGELHLSISCELMPSTPARTPANKAPSFLGKAGIVGLEKAVEVLDTLGSSMTNLNSGGFATGVASRGNKISILAFEVANTIAKGANLLQSLSEENIQFLKKEIFHSEGVQKLVSTDMNELLSIAASDKREEFDLFSREVIRFGNLCKDPQWHNLDRFFSKLDSDPDVHKQLREEADMTMQELTTLVQLTSELYHELHALDRFEQDYQQKLEEVDSLHLPRKGLPPIGRVSTKKPERLGVAGLALHYANLITQIDNIASRPTSLPPNMRDTLYNGLPPTVKTSLRSQIQLADAKEELTAPKIKAEMEKTLRWLVPVATDTTKAHQGFGWVGEWANTGNEFGKETSTPNNQIRLQTLYHADKHKVESCILELITWLHHLVNLVRYRDNGLKSLPARSPTRKGLNTNTVSLSNTPKTYKVNLSSEDRNLLEDVMKRRNLVPGLSKSQEFVTVKNKKNKIWALSRSTGSSPRRGVNHQKADVLDVLDGLDSSYSAPRDDIR